MAMQPETREQISRAIRHPMEWWKGADLPEEKLRPWEGGIQFFGEMLGGFMGGFQGLIGRIYEGNAEGFVKPIWNSISGVVTTVWDMANDPVIGVYMDKHRDRFTVNMYRWIMRMVAVWGPLTGMLSAFRLGMSPLQRVIIWGLVSMAGDILHTFNGVASQRIWLGITQN